MCRRSRTAAPPASATSPASEFEDCLKNELPGGNSQVKRSKLITTGIALCGALLIPAFGMTAQPAAGAPPGAGPTARPPGAPGATQRPMVSCQRGGLQHAVRLYLEGQAKGDYSALPLATGLGYWEDMKPADIATGFLTKKLVIDKHLSLYDDQSCQTY